MKNTLQLIVRLAVLLALLLAALPGSADMNRQQCIRNCDTTIKLCEKACTEHAKKPKAIQECKKGCQKIKKTCIKQCNKR